MENFEIPPSVKEMTDLFTESLKSLSAIQDLLSKEIRKFLQSELSPRQEERVEGRRAFFFCLTTIRHLNREWNKPEFMELINQTYKTMCEEFDAGRIEQDIIDSLKAHKK